MKARVCALALVAVFGCAPDREQSSREPEQSGPNASASLPIPEEFLDFELGDQSYAIPASYVRALRIGSDNSFIRIKIPDFPAEIVVDEKSSGKVDKSGAPQIFSINDRNYPRLDYSSRDDESVVVCRVDMAAQSGCGTLFDHAGVEWTLLFPIGMRDRADDLVKESEQLLDRFTSSRAGGQHDTSDEPQEDDRVLIFAES